VDYVASLPNPWAGIVTTDVDSNTYPYQLARVPGLPVRASYRSRDGGQVVIAVTGIDAGPVKDGMFQNP
jgi:hypothetical protein